MKTPEYEKLVYDLISSWIKGHEDLQISVPSVDSIEVSGSRVSSPDLLIENTRTGRSLGIEIKTGVRELPIGVYPQLQAMHSQFASTNNDFLVLSSVPASEVLKSNFVTSGISFVQEEDPIFAFKAIEPRLTELKTKG